MRASDPLPHLQCMMVPPSCATSRGFACRERGVRSEQTALCDGGGSGSDELEANPIKRNLLEEEKFIASLPRLPEPDYCQMRAEATCGNSLVLFLIFIFVAPMQAFVNATEPDKITVMMRIWIFAVYAEAAIAIFCLLGLMFGDPGTIKRTPENCLPQPDLVAEKLRNGQSLSNVGNITHEDGGSVFCIRCLVWRTNDGNTHHCSTCQRCVEDFDHHCGVFGRCIAGDGFGGNMGYFKTLILMGVLGCATCVSFMVLSTGSQVSDRSYRYHHRHPPTYPSTG